MTMSPIGAGSPSIPSTFSATRRIISHVSVSKKGKRGQVKLGTLEKLLDCFCGSGTTAAVAEKLERRWITCDLGRFAIHTTRKRLLSIPDIKPFVVQNLGKYERQAWQAAEFADPTQRVNAQLRYYAFILQLYHATPIEGYTWIHGLKASRLVHVGSVDAPICATTILILSSKQN